MAHVVVEHKSADAQASQLGRGLEQRQMRQPPEMIRAQQHGVAVVLGAPRDPEQLSATARVDSSSTPNLNGFTRDSLDQLRREGLTRLTIVS